MRKLPIKVTYDTITHGTFKNPDRIHQTRLTEELNRLGYHVSRPTVINWFVTHKIPGDALPYLRRIDYDKVVTSAKRHVRKPLPIAQGGQE